MSTPIEIESVTTEQLIASIVDGAAKHSKITDSFIKTFVFYGHTLDYWLQDISVEIPEDVTPESFRTACTTLGRKLQKANYFYSIANTLYNALHSSGDIKKSDLIAALVEHYSKGEARRPAAATLDAMASSYMSGTVNNKIAARVLRDFWRDRRDGLIEVRKVLEQIGMSMHMEMKYHEI